METSRPLHHFTPPAGWMNDPNGLVFFQGEWHLFYQYLPAIEAEHWKKQWGHAISRDLAHWEHLPVALEADELGGIWSGSCVVDWHDSSGFFDGGSGLIAIFTHGIESRDGKIQSQSLAYSRDAGRSWTKYADNPVLTSDSPDFRDPKVLWHKSSQSWIMIVAAGSKLEIYRSPDLKMWTHASSFGADHLPGWCWECPDLFSLPDENGTEVWILVSSALTGDNFTGGFGGCAVFYYAGQFDGYTFTSGDAAPRRLSYGPDDYAPVTFSDTDDERRVMMGWLNHWGYAGNMGTTPWKGQMTLPRVLGWQNGALSQSLPTEVEGVWPQHQLSDEQSHSPLAVNSPVWEVLLPPLCDAWKLEARQNSELVFSLTRDEATSVWRLERFASALPPEGDAKPGWQQFFLSPVEAPLLSAGAGETRIVVDTCSVEVFGDDGTTLFCAQIFPTGSEWKISVAAA